MPMKWTLKELFEKEKVVLAPEVYDCASTATVEACGYKATVLSGAELTMSRLGIPDLGIMNVEEVIQATERICNYSYLPMVVDVENGYGPAINTYHNCKRIAKAGAAGAIIVDGPEPRIGGSLPLEEAVGKYKAAHDALEGSDCILVARTDVADLNEAMDRCNSYLEAGADMTLVFMINYIAPEERYDACKVIAKNVPGWKWYPDLGCHDGKADVTVEQVGDIGFNFVGVHYLLGTAMWAMLDAGRENFKNKNNVYSTMKYDFSPLGTVEDLKRWVEFESKYVDDPEIEKRWPYPMIKKKVLNIKDK